MRRLPQAAVACLAGAGVALFGATRVWSVEVTARPGLPELRATTTGAEAQPWLIALALIALAGTGALLATRGVLRRLLGVLLIVVGAGVGVAAVAGRAGLDRGAAGPGAVIWPVACVAGGALVAGAGLSAARHGAGWPTMGARYERRTVPASGTGRDGGPAPSPSAGPRGRRRPERRADGVPAEPTGGEQRTGARATAGAGDHAGRTVGDRATGSGGEPVEESPVDTRAAWDALDRGDDPTVR